MADIPLVSPLFAGLFGDDETAALFSAEAEIAAMVEVERALARLQGSAGLIPQAAADAIDRELSDMTLAPAELAAGTAAAGVPVPALVAALRQKLSRPAADYLHFGATSQDIVDTGLMLRLARTLALFEARLADIVAQLSALSTRHRATPMAGRTRGQIATPVSFACGSRSGPCRWPRRGSVLPGCGARRWSCSSAEPPAISARWTCRDVRRNWPVPLPASSASHPPFPG